MFLYWRTIKICQVHSGSGQIKNKGPKQFTLVLVGWFFPQFWCTYCYVAVALYLQADLFTRKVNLGLRSRPERKEGYMSINIYLLLLLLFCVLEVFLIKIRTTVIDFSVLYLESTHWSLSLWVSLVKYLGIKVRGRIASVSVTGLPYIFI